MAEHTEHVNEQEILQTQSYARQEMLPLYYGKQSLLAQKKIGIIGVGGLGGVCSLLLSNAGVGFLRLADFDAVSLSNLHRQLLFTERDALTSELKIIAASREIEARNRYTTIEAFNLKVDEESFAAFVDGLDVVMDLSDNAESRHKISKLCLEHHCDLISGAVSSYTALLAIFAYSDQSFVEQYGCYQCLTHGDSINTKVGITGPIAASASSLVAHMALEYLLGNKEMFGKVLRYDLQHLKIQHLALQRDSSCSVCSQI